MTNIRITLLLLGGLMMMVASGCTVALFGAGAGAGVAGATYVMGKLEDEVDAPVPKVQQATVAALKSLELPVDKERGDKLGAELESETADNKKIWVSINSLPSSRSKIVIRVGLFGDETHSRQILEAIRTHGYKNPLNLSPEGCCGRHIWTLGRGPKKKIRFWGQRDRFRERIPAEP